MGYEIRFHGLACFSIHWKNIVVVFDPHNGKSLNLPEPDIRNADIVLCSHKHYDHNAGKDLVASKDAVILEETAGSFEHKGLKIIGNKVMHGGGKQWGWNVVYSVQLPSNEVIIHAGDIGNIPDQKTLDQILVLGTPEICFLPVGGEFTVNAKQAIQLAKVLKTKIANVACHYLYGPLKCKEDFQGMTTEKPFLEAVGGKQNVFFVKEVWKPNIDNQKLWIMFLPRY